MSYKQNFYNTFRGNYYNDGIAPQTQNYHFPSPPVARSDEEVVHTFESKLQTLGRFHAPRAPVFIGSISKHLTDIAMALNRIKEEEKDLSNNIRKLTEAEWEEANLKITTLKDSISESFSIFNESNLNMFKKLLAKRSAKRMRLKRVRIENRKDKESRIRKLQEKSRKIDENLQKIKDDINKAKQEEERKLATDSILKEVLRKKHDAKKCIVKVDALTKLRKARQNTSTGRGEVLNEKDAQDFGTNIEKLRSLWMFKLSQYDQEETKLRSTIKHQSELALIADSNTAEIKNNLAKWTLFLFGENKLPQVDFRGDIEKFISTRYQWDQYVDSDGTSLPVGWALPK